MRLRRETRSRSRWWWLAICLVAAAGLVNHFAAARKAGVRSGRARDVGAAAEPESARDGTPRAAALAALARVGPGPGEAAWVPVDGEGAEDEAEHEHEAEYEHEYEYEHEHEHEYEHEHEHEDEYVNEIVVGAAAEVEVAVGDAVSYDEGVVDSDDSCPALPRAEGEDHEGCPDVDPAVAPEAAVPVEPGGDAVDSCPDGPESWNGSPDDDSCPEPAPDVTDDNPELTQDDQALTSQ